jgi:hypothetical protein
MKFYVDIWLSDPNLRMCKLSSKGLLIDMMAYAHGGHPYGYLTNGGKKLDANSLSILTGETPDVIRMIMADLLEHGRIKIDEDGTIFIPRMVKDGKTYSQQQEAGSLGGNPKIAKKNSEKRTQERDNLESSLSANLKLHWQDWKEDRRQRRIPMTLFAEILQLKKIINWGDDKAIVAIKKSIENGWRGLFSPTEVSLPETPRIDPDIEAYAKQAVMMIRNKQPTRNFWKGVQDKFSPFKKQKIEREVERMLNNPEEDNLKM